MNNRSVLNITRSGRGDRPEDVMAYLTVFLFAFVILSVLVIGPSQACAQDGTVSGEASYMQPEDNNVRGDAAANQNPELTEEGALQDQGGEEGQDDLTPGDKFASLSLQEAYNVKRKVSPSDIDPRNMDSLFFTLWQYSLLQEAKRGFLTRPPTAAEMQDDGTTPRKRGVRELSLGGIVYNSADHWTIWLNGQRVGPDALPDSVIDIDVNREYVQLKWFDSYTNLIFPLRLRPHERFNLDTRIFLPGDGNKLN